MKHGLLARMFVCIGTSWIAATVPATAQDAQDRLKDCRVIYDAMSRLFCYDSVVDTITMGAPARVPQPAPAARAPVLTPPPSMTAPSAPVVAAPTTTPAPVATAPRAIPNAPRAIPNAPRAVPSPPPTPAPSAAPLTTASSLPPATPRFGEDNLPPERRPAPERDEPDQMRARIASVAVDPYGDAVLTLDNGQVWKQTEGRAYRVKTGAEITIKKGMLGAYFLSAKESSRTVKVKRVQ
ncbi:MAG: hypothetical protein KDE14_12340 [Rhodobacteraceae bacterium]|nr:hypothetical protein [Paracoccaceae bacterium]